MYRIKTDIRQYKCESKGKVEKLIRNWVIRPNDLIFHTETQEWSPIGDHPSFVALFELLAETERGEPDTVVTEPPSESLHRDDREENEVTHIKFRPAFDEESESSPEVEEGQAEDELDARSTDVFDQEQIASGLSERSQSESSLAPPETPEGVEPQHHDEVTVMTEKTLDMLTEDSEPLDDASPGSVVEADEDAEPKVIVASQEEEAPPPKLGRHDLPEEFFATNEISSPVDRATVMDEVPTSETSEAEEDEEVTTMTDSEAVAQEDKPQWRIHLEESSAVDEAWDEMADDLRATHELTDEEIAAAATARKEQQDLEGDSELTNPDDLDDDEWEDDVHDFLGAVHQNRDFVSEGYTLPLPFEVGPSEYDISLGLRRSMALQSVKIRNFPYPEPKKLKEVQHQVFLLTRESHPPADRSGLVVLGIVAMVFVLVALVMYLFS